MKLYLHTLKNGTAVKQVQTLPPFTQTYDVCVCGLGTAGTMAAIAAARQGASVLGVERLPGMGGTATYGCVWDYFYGADGGAYQALNDAAWDLEEQTGIAPCEPHGVRNRCISGFAKEQVSEQAALAAGCTLWYESVVCGVYTDEAEKICGVVVLREGKTDSVGVKELLDCTGEVLLCRMMGARIVSGRAGDGRQMQFSRTSAVLDHHLARGVWTFCGYSDVLYGADYSAALLRAACKPPFLRAHYTEKDRMIYEGAIVGSRESLRIVPKEPVTLEEFLQGDKTSQPLAYSFGPLDNPNHEYAKESAAHLDWVMLWDFTNCGFSFGVPLGMCVPTDSAGDPIDHLLVAGKGVGVDHDLASNYRMRKDFEKLGEALGIISALAAKKGISPSEVPYATYAPLLRASGCLQEKNHRALCDLRNFENGDYAPYAFPHTEEEAKALLQGVNSGVAYYQIAQDARHKTKDWTPCLRNWCENASGRLQEHAAIALGILGDSHAAPVLRRLLQPAPVSREAVTAAKGWAPFFTDAMRAILLLGRLRDAEALPLLSEIVRTRAAALVAMLPQEKDYAEPGFAETLYLDLTQAAISEITTGAPSFGSVK